MRWTLKYTNMSYEKKILFEFNVDGTTIGSSFITVADGKVNTDSIEDEFYSTLRKNEKGWLEEAEEEEHEEIIDHLTHEQEEKLKAKHAEDYHGTDDDMSDAYEDWLMDLSVSELKEIL